MDELAHDDPSFGEVDVIETEELAENNIGEPEGVPMQDVTENGEVLEKRKKAKSKNLDELVHDEPSFGEVGVIETEELAENW